MKKEIIKYDSKLIIKIINSEDKIYLNIAQDIESWKI